MTLSQCRICCSKDVVSKLKKSDFPINIWPSQTGLVPSMELHIFECAQCHHVQLQNFNETEIEALYLGDYFNLENSTAHLTRLDLFKQDDNLNTIFQNARLLDIGGGRNSIIHYVNTELNESTVIDFSIESKVKNQANKAITGDFLTHSFADSSFDIIAAFHCFEHFEQPRVAIEKAFALLSEGGRLLIEVPHGNRVATQMPYYTYFLQHISVFTPSSLTRLLENAGFFIERLYETGQAVFVVARKSTHSSLSHISRREHKDDTNLFNQSQLSLNRLETQLLARLQNKEQGIGLYGAGGSSTLLIFWFSWLATKIKYAFDMDTQKQGRFIPQTHIPILAPEQLNTQRPQTLIFHSESVMNSVQIHHDCQRVSLQKLLR